MAFQRSVITDFTAGELSQKFSGRFDTELYNKGNQVVDNWVPHPGRSADPSGRRVSGCYQVWGEGKAHSLCRQ